MEKSDRILVSPREASQLLSVSQRTLGSLTAAGTIPSMKVGRLRRYSVRDLERFAEGNDKVERAR